MKISYWSSARKAYPSDHIGFHDPQYGLVMADPLLSVTQILLIHCCICTRKYQGMLKGNMPKTQF